MKKRNIALSIIFTLITCGIYGLYWFVCLTDETNQAWLVNRKPQESWH